MVISQCQVYGSIACALRSGLLETELKEKQPKTTTRLRLRTQSSNTIQPTEHILVDWMDADGSTGPENCLRHKQIIRLGIQLHQIIEDCSS